MDRINRIYRIRSKTMNDVLILLIL